MHARVKYLDEAAFVAESGSGHGVVLDGPAEAGGRDRGVRPMEMVLMGMGGCAAFDVVQILKKARQPIIDCDAQLSAIRAEAPPKVFTRIDVHFVVTGDGLAENQVRRAVRLSAEKYCSASIMLGRTAEIHHDFEIRSPGAR